MHFFGFLSLAISVISIVLGTPDSVLPLFVDYESYDNYESYDDNSIVTPLIGGESEFPAIESVSFFSSYFYLHDLLILIHLYL